MTTEVQPAVTVQVASIYPSMREIIPHFSCEVFTQQALDDAIANGYCEIYIHAQDGLFKRCGLTHGRSVTIPAIMVPGAASAPAKPKVVQDLKSFLPDGKIPIKFLHQIEAFFRKVMEANKGVNLEAQAFVIWNPSLGYHIRIPEQTVSGASVSYKWENFLAEDGSDVIILDMHSHNSMGAFFSGTDDNDDRGNCTISGVIGEMNKQKPAMVFRFNLPGNVKINQLTVEDIFVQEGETFAVPEEWLGQVKRTAPVTTSYTPGNYYGGRGAGGNGNFHGGRGSQTRSGQATTGNVVVNPNARNSGLMADDMNLLEQFGYPFALEEEGTDLPFPHRPLVQGRKSRNNGQTKSLNKKNSRLPRKKK